MKQFFSRHWIRTVGIVFTACGAIAFLPDFFDGLGMVESSAVTVWAFLQTMAGIAVLCLVAIVLIVIFGMVGLALLLNLRPRASS